MVFLLAEGDCYSDFYARILALARASASAVQMSSTACMYIDTSIATESFMHPHRLWYPCADMCPRASLDFCL